MRRKVKINDLIEHGFLKINEEVYMEFRGLYFTARIREGGKIETNHGLFKSPSQPAYLNMRSNEEFCQWRDKRIEQNKNAMISGWNHWKTWNGTTFDQLRKKIEIKG